MKRVEIKKCSNLNEKQLHWALLLDADPDKDVVMEYLPDSEMYVLNVNDEAVSEAVMTLREDGQIELKNLATDPAHRKMGYAKMLIEHLFTIYHGQYEKMYVGTSHAGLYEHFGFTYAYTIKNFFVDNYPEPIIDEVMGPCIDMIYYKRLL